MSSRTSSGHRELLRSLLRAHRRDIALGAGLRVVHQICEALVAVLIGVVVDRAIVTGDGGAMLRWGGVLTVVFVFLALGGLYGWFLQNRAGERIAHELRVRLATRVVDPRGGTEEVARSGEVLSLAASDAGRVGRVSGVVGDILSAGIVLAGGAAYLLSTSWRLGLVVLLGLPLLVWLSQRLAAPLEQRSSAEQAAVAHASGVAVDLVTGLRVLKGMGAEAAAASRYALVSRAARDGRIHAARYVGLSDAVVLALSGLFVVVVAWIGGRLALSGAISVGELVAATGLAAFLVGPLSILSGLPSSIAVVRASAVRVSDFLAAPTSVDDGGRGPSAGGELALHGVTGGTLREVDLTVPAGTWLGVVALDRRDATSLLDLLARRSDPAAGRLTWGAAAFPDLAIDALRAAVLVGDHDAVLFEGSVLDNVRGAAVADLPLADLDDVLTASATDEVVEALPAGAGSPVGERGRWLSGGQRQRVALARALAVDPDVLVLHDPTTAIDAATEHRIAGRLRSVRARRTTVLVTTSPALLAACDRVVVLRGGRLVADADHHDLAGLDADYRQAVLA